MTYGAEDTLVTYERRRMGDFGRQRKILIFEIFLTQNEILKI
jgi:hypothetical protein